MSDEHPESGSASTRRRARDRQAQRHRTRQTSEQSSVRARMPRQIRPLDSLNLPAIKLPVNRAILGVIGAVVFIAAIVLVLGRLRNDPATEHDDAIWIGREWTLDGRAPTDIAAYAERLRQRQIGTVYAWVSWLQPDGSWNGAANFGSLTGFAQAFKTAYPDVVLYGWITLPTEREPGVTRIDDFALQTQVAALAEQIVGEYGFDGVFLTADPVWNGDQNFLSLLRTVRAAVGLDVPIGVALPPDWSPAAGGVPVPPLIAPGTEWATQYKQSVAILVDHIAIMAFGSGMTSIDDFQAWVAYQTMTYATAIAELNTDIQIVIAMPTAGSSVARLDPNIENIETTAAGVLEGIAAAGDAGEYIVGVALYADWETDDGEWDRYRQAWLER